ncbi:hypothetical protein B0H19DRAFT_1064679 [Mycena capillaripes]|nr:hypothetical protein B0H19DRAFT_1064679 [Mycena capillaripes]
MKSASPAAAGTVLNILNFPKENAIDLANGGCIELTAVQIFHASLTTNQHALPIRTFDAHADIEHTGEWTLSGGPSTFQIISKCGMFLTYPGAGSTIALRSQATTCANTTAAWTIQFVNASAPAVPFRTNWMAPDERENAREDKNRLPAREQGRLRNKWTRKLGARKKLLELNTVADKHLHCFAVLLMHATQAVHSTPLPVILRACRRSPQFSRRSEIPTIHWHLE